jgi:hypothetical protein
MYIYFKTWWDRNVWVREQSMSRERRMYGNPNISSIHSFSIWTQKSLLKISSRQIKFMVRGGMKIKYNSRNHWHITNRMIADTFYTILKQYIYQVKTESQLRLLFNRWSSNENTSDRIPKIFYPNSKVKAMIFLKYIYLLTPISVTNKILVCCKVTLYHSGLKNVPISGHSYCKSPLCSHSCQYKITNI